MDNRKRQRQVCGDGAAENKKRKAGGGGDNAAGGSGDAAGGGGDAAGGGGDAGVHVIVLPEEEKANLEEAHQAHPVAAVAEVIVLSDDSEQANLEKAPQAQAAAAVAEVIVLSDDSEEANLEEAPQAEANLQEAPQAEANLQEAPQAQAAAAPEVIEISDDSEESDEEGEEALDAAVWNPLEVRQGPHGVRRGFLNRNVPLFNMPELVLHKIYSKLPVEDKVRLLSVAKFTRRLFRRDVRNHPIARNLRLNPQARLRYLQNIQAELVDVQIILDLMQPGETVEQAYNRQDQYANGYSARLFSWVSIETTREIVINNWTREKLAQTLYTGGLFSSFLL